MSAYPSAVPALAPERKGPQIAPPPPAKPGRKWLLPLLLAGLAAGIFGAALYVRSKPAQKTAADGGTRVAKASIGAIARVMRVSGATAAKNYFAITAPMMRGPDAGRSLVLMEVVKSGAYVKKGDMIAQIDAQAIKDHVDDINSLVQQAESDIKKREAEQAIELENLRQNLRLAKANLDKARLDAKASPIRTSIDQEILKLGIEEAEATYKELQTDFVTTQEMYKSEIKILDYTRERHERHRNRHRHDVTLFTIHAPINGLAVMQSIWRGGEMGQVQQGDQLSPGQPFMKIVDPASMLLEAKVNQAESEGIRIGEPAELHFDAFPDLTLSGKVASVGAMGVQGWRENYYIRTIPVKVAILGQDPRVIPDLSGSADLTLDRRDNAVVVPLDAIESEGGKSMVFVKDGEGFKQRYVELGLRNFTDTSVVSGLRSGEEVAVGHSATATP